MFDYVSPWGKRGVWLRFIGPHVRYNIHSKSLFKGFLLEEDVVVLKGPRICWGRRVFYLSHLRFAAAVRGSLGISRGLSCWLLDQCSLESSGWLPLRTSLLRCVPVLNAGIAFLDGSGVGTNIFLPASRKVWRHFWPFFPSGSRTPRPLWPPVPPVPPPKRPSDSWGVFLSVTPLPTASSHERTLSSYNVSHFISLSAIF